MPRNIRKKFNCPACGGLVASMVIDGAIKYNGFERYRKCELCGAMFVTKEKVIRLSGKPESTGD